MQAVRLSGRFMNQQTGEPVEGIVRFMPNKLWLDDPDGNTYPVLAPEVNLINGNFSVLLTRTDQHELPWHYTILCPMGKWTIKIEDDGPLELKTLVPKRYA